MSITLKITLLILLFIQLVLIMSRVKRKRFTMRYAVFWIILIGIMSLVVIFPTFVFKLSHFAGFEKSSNMIFLLSFFFLFYLSFIITTMVSNHNDKIKILTQEISMLKERVDNSEKRK